MYLHSRQDSRVALINRSEEHTSELQSPCNLVCRLLLEKKKQRIANENGLDEAQAVIAVGTGYRIHISGCHADGDAEDQCAVRDPLAKRLALAPFGIHVVRVEIAGLARVDDDVGFRDGPAEGFAKRAGLIVFEVPGNDHSSRLI